MISALQLKKGNLTSAEFKSPEIVNTTDVKLKVHVAGVCGTDIQILDGSFPSADDFIPGHEISGVVTEIGEDVKHLKVGDRVCVNPFDWCGSCLYCVRGQTQFCIHEGMKTAIGIMKDGGWQEYIVVPNHLCFEIPGSMSFKESVFCQPLSNCIRGWDNIGHLHNESKIIVAGAGIIGLIWAALFHHHGYRDVTITEVGEERKSAAIRLDLGFRVCHPDEIKSEKEKAMQENDETWGYDAIVDCTGEKAGIEEEFKWLRKGSVFLLFGICGKSIGIDFEVYQIYKNEITIISSFLNQFCYARTIKLVDGMSKRYLDFGYLNVKCFHLDEYQDAISALRKGEISKAVFVFE